MPTEWKVEKVKVTPLVRDLEIRLNSITKNGGKINNVMVLPTNPPEFVVVYKQPVVTVPSSAPPTPSPIAAPISVAVPVSVPSAQTSTFVRTITKAGKK